MTDAATKNWYIVHTYSGFEKKVAESLGQRVQAYGLQNEIGEILIPTEDVVDPTGAGDAFAGGIMGYLASDNTPPPSRLRRAMAYGTVVASLTVEGFGLDRLKRTDRQEIDQRLEKYRMMLSF